MIDVDEMTIISDEELAMKNKIVDKAHETASNVVEIRLKNALNIERKIILTFTK